MVQRIQDEAGVKLETLRHDLTSRFREESEQQEVKLRTIRLEQEARTEELQSTSRNLRDRLDEEKRVAQQHAQQLKVELEEHKRELARNAKTAEKADQAVQEISQSWHKVIVRLSLHPLLISLLGYGFWT